VLLRTLFIIALFAVVAETIVHGVHALAQVALRRSAASGVQRQFESATTAARQSLAAAVEAGGDPQNLTPPAPAPAATCVLAAANGCAVEGRATISFTTAALPSATPCPSDACTIYVQDNDAVDEGRVRATIAAQALAPNGAVLASRSESVTFRTFRVAPYAALAGSLDGSLGRLAGSGDGDDGGAVPNGTAPGSLIDVIYENRATKKSMPANVWHSQVERIDAVREPWSP
jgi:hypothetical protein